MRWSPEKIEHVCRTLIPNYDPWDNAEGFYFDHAEAQRTIEFIEQCLCLTNSKWLGMPFLLQDWQGAIVGNLFGWKRRDDDTRRYRKCLLFTAMKSGKTELAAAICNALLFIDGEPSPEIVTAAGNADQATKIFNAAKTMVETGTYFEDISEIFQRSILCPPNRGVLKVINASAKTKFGGNIFAACVDELHVHPDGDLVDVLERSMRTRRQPLLLYTTTAGDNPESIAGEVYFYGCQVRDKVHSDPEFLPVIFEVPLKADISDPANWKLAQPNLGVTVPIAEYERDYREALAIPRKMRVFRQLGLNQWVESAQSWLSPNDWRACADPSWTDPPDGATCYGGLDVSAVQDTTAIALTFPDGDRLRVLPFIFLPKDTAAGRARRQKRDKAPYSLWGEQGHIILTEGNCIDHDAVADKIIETAERWDLRELQIDPHNATAISTRLIAAGINVVSVRQGHSLNEAAKMTEKLVLSRKLVHPGNPAFTWQVANTAVETDRRDNVILNKQRSASRIDSVVAMVMAVNSAKFGAGLNPETETTNYELITLDW
jgi:phage terminase large subunit-like protein